MPAKSIRRNTATRPARKDPAMQGVIDAAYRLQKAGSHQQAEILYRKVLVAEPGNPFALYALGTIALNRGEMETAVSFLRQALDQGYASETVFTHLGIALQTLGRTEEALEIYRTAERLEPKNPRYPSNAAVVLAQKGEHESALAEAKKALRLDANFAPACMNAGFFLQTLGRWQEAVEMFQRTLHLEPGNAQVREAMQALQQKLAHEGP